MKIGAVQVFSVSLSPNPYTIYLNPLVAIIEIIKMTKEDLETKARKAVLSMEKKVTGIYDVLCDLSMKLCHIIKRKGDYYSLPERNNHYK